MKHIFTVPTYYGKFVCKGKDCRDCCCYGWNISLSLKEYFSLLGLPCTKDLRYKLDGAFHLAEPRDEFEYAQITPRFDGDCPLHMDNGYCALQYECGEDVLPKICRYYPRSPRLCFGRYEACMTNSCEGVIEAIDRFGFSLEERELDFDLQIDETDKNIQAQYFELRSAIIELLSDNAHSLTEKLLSINLLIEEYEQRDNKQAVIEKRYDFLQTINGSENINADTLLTVAAELLSFYEQGSVSIGELCKKALDRIFTESEDPFKYYTDSYASLCARFPRFENLLTDVLKNHFFYEKFPFSDKREKFMEESLSLMGLVILIKSLLVGNTEKISDLSDIIDILGSVFRLAEHSSFYKNTAVLLEKAGYDGINALLK